MPRGSSSNRHQMRARPRRRQSGSGEPIYQSVLTRGFRRQQPHSSFPDRTVVNLDYWYTGRQNPGAVASNDTVFSANSLFDPEVSGVGHQPREFDTWASVYGKYRVLECLAELHVRQRASHGLSVSLVPTNTSTALAGADIPLELPRAVNLGLTGSSQPVAHANVRVLPRAILGMEEREYMADDETAALVTASPSQQVYLHVFVASPDGATAVDYEFSIRIRYRAEFYDRKVLSPSALVTENAELRRQLAAAHDEGIVVDSSSTLRDASREETRAAVAALSAEYVARGLARLSRESSTRVYPVPAPPSAKDGRA